MVKIVQLSDVLARMDACGTAREWVRSTGNPYFIQTWMQCKRGSWLMWLVARVAPAQVTIALMVVLLEKHLAEDLRVSPDARESIHLVRRWLSGTVDERTLRSALTAAKKNWSKDAGTSLAASLYLFHYTVRQVVTCHGAPAYLAADDAAFFLEYLNGHAINLDAEIAESIRERISPTYMERAILAWWEAQS